MTKILKLPDVIGMTGLSRSSIYALSKAGKFPKPVKMSEKSSGWLLSEVENHIAQRAKLRGVSNG